MHSIFKTFFLSLCIIANTSFAYSQTASILPPARTQLFDNNGNPLVSGKVDYYIPGTTTRKTTWQDAGETIPNTNPVVLDGAGRATMLGDGSYRQVVRDRNNNLIWDATTSSTGTGGGGTTATVGDGQPVGSIQLWAGMIAPAAYAFAYGQEFTRAGFPELFAALTSQQNVSCTLGSPTLTGIGNTQNLPIGAPIESTCFNPGATVLSKTVSTVVASVNAIISTSTSARFFPYGNGDGSATFNVPDMRGSVPMGRCNMGGIDCTNSTITYYGVNPSAMNAKGGNESKTLALSNLPNVTPSWTGTPGAVSVASTVSNIPYNSSAIPVGSSGTTGVQVGAIASQIISTGNFTPVGSNGSINGGVTQTAFSAVQSTVTTNYVIKITPDSNPNSFFGVASIGGMTGVILCGFGITCAGNTISAIASTVPPPTLTTLGGLFQLSPIANNFVTGVDGLGNLTTAQPSFSNLSGSIATGQIPTNTVTDAQLAQAPALTVVGNGTNATANKTDLAGTTDQIMRVASAGTSLGFGSINLAASAAVGSSLLALTNGGCNTALTASNGGILWSNATQCQILAGTATARLPLLSGASATPVWGAFTLPASVTSGGLAYFSSTSAMASSAVMTANAFITGGGAGVAPNSVAITGLVLGNGASAPTAYGGTTCTNQFARALSAVGAATCNTVNLASDVTGILPSASFPALTGDVTTASGAIATTIANNAVTNAKSAQMTAATIKGNPSASTANATDFTIQGLVNSTTPSATLDFVPIYDSATGTIKRVTPALIASAGVAGVSSFNGRTGSVTPTQGDYSTSLIPGIASAALATAGNIGEVVSSVISSGSAVALTSTVVANITSISLTAGDWDVHGSICSAPAGGATITSNAYAINTTSAVLPNFEFISLIQIAAGAGTYCNSVPTRHFNLASTTTVYLMAGDNFSGGTASAYGQIYARRAR